VGGGRGEGGFIGSGFGLGLGVGLEGLGVFLPHLEKGAPG